MAVPQGFRPSLSPQQIKDYRRLYEQQPDKFDDQTVEAIQQHAEYYRLPFAENDNSALGKVGNLMKQAGSGFAEGFTTLRTGEPPKDDYEAIARNIGHLAGFVGYVPQAPFKLLKIKYLSDAAKALKGTSVPMVAAKYATRAAKQIVNPIYNKALGARAAATGTARGFLQSNVVNDMVSGAFHLGVASSVSSWQGGVDEMMTSFIGGAATGAAFRAIGNFVQTGDKQADMILRTLSASLMTGLPSTMRGDTTPMQIYEYLLGAYFGKNEMPVHRRMGFKHLAKMQKEKIEDPELVDGWHNMDKIGQKFVTRKLKESKDRKIAVAWEVLRNQLGLPVEKMEQLAKEWEKGNIPEESISFTEEGEAMRRLTKEEKKELDNSSEDVDPQIIPSRISIHAKSFVDTNMEAYLDKQGKSKTERLGVAVKLNERWLKLINDNKEAKTNPAQEMIDYISKKHPDFLIEEPEHMFWTNLGSMRVRQRAVPMITMSNGVPRIMKPNEGGGTINDAGNRKQLSEEPKLIEEIWSMDYLAKKNIDLNEARGGYAILDHIVKGNREFELNDYKEKLIKDKKKTKAVKSLEPKYREAKANQLAEQQYNKEIGKLYKYMDAIYLPLMKQGKGKNKGRLVPIRDKNGAPQVARNNMYYYGGKGDKNKLYFVKYHPDTPILKKDIDSAMGLIKKSLKKFGARTKDITSIQKDRDMYIKTYANGIGPKKIFRGKKLIKTVTAEEEAGRLYDRAFISNVIYDARLNGFKGLEEIHKIFGVSDKKSGKAERWRFINNAKNFNKRSQIWLTSGYSADPEAVSLAIENVRKGKAELTEGDRGKELNIKIIEDVGNEINKGKIGILNHKLFPTTDGAIYGRSDVIDGLNRQAGLPEDGGVNKSFIVSPSPQYGALLGKYMIFSTSPKMEAYMQEKNIHLIIPQSAAKQVGFRKIGKLIWNKGPDVKATTYKLPIQDIKVVPSEKSDKKSLDPQSIPKQLYTNFTPYSYFNKKLHPKMNEKDYNKKMHEILNDMYETMSGEKVLGDLEINDLTMRMSKNPKAYEKEIPYIINNLDRVGVNELLWAIKAPGNERFANEAYSRIMRVNRDIIQQMRADGELTDKQLKDISDEMVDFDTVHGRIISLSPNSIAAHLHKFSRDYRMSVIRNYIINNITRPKVGNSGSARLRPYEIGMYSDTKKDMRAGVGDTKRLEKEDDIFFLDDGFRNLRIDLSGLGKKVTTLEKVWDTYLKADKSGNKEQAKLYKEILRSVLVRVPMDSMSGAHALNFAGFTGIRGYNALIHGKSMEALGGADLDGDKTFVFFGGRGADGAGQGFKKEWKDAYEWSKDEFLLKGKKIEDSKDAKNPLTGETYHSELTVGGNQIFKGKKGSQIVDEVNENLALQYSPFIRQQASDAASEGRGKLGIAVTQTSYIRSAYSSIRDMKDSIFHLYNVKLPGIKNQTYTVRVRAKTSDKAMRSFRGVSRAAVGLASDPMDEAGLNFGKYGEKLLNKQLNALFSYDVIATKDFKDKGKIIKKGTPLYNLTKRLDTFTKRKAVVDIVKDINQAIYGRNWAESRRFQMWEIQEKLDSIDHPTKGIKPKHRNTFLTKLASDLKGLDWSDDVIKRLKLENLDEIYIEHHNDLEKYDFLKEVIGRRSMAVLRGKYKRPEKEGDRPFEDGFLDVVLKLRLHTKDGMEIQTNPNRKEYKKGLFNREIFKSYRDKSDFDPNDMIKRKRYLNDIVRKAEDFVINDFSDIASMRLIHSIAKNLPRKKVAEIAKEVDRLKKFSYVLANKTKEINRENMSLDPIHIAYLEALEKEMYGDVPTASLNQSQIDSQIKVLKKDLNSQESKLFDAMMLGTLWTGKEIDIQSFYKRMGKPKEPWVQEEVDNLILDAKRTSLARVGYNSEAIPDSSVKAMLNEYQKLFDYTIDIFNPKELKKKEEATEKLDKPDEIIDGEGNRIVGQTLEQPYVDAKAKKYFDEFAPFVGLREGKLSQEDANLAMRIKDHLDFYSDVTAHDLNGVMRWLNLKDINIATKSDWETLDRWFTMTREGTWWQRIMRPVKDKAAKLTGWHWLMFPKAVDADLQRHTLMLADSRRPFKDKYGWVHGTAREPENMMLKIQRPVHLMQQQATQVYEEYLKEWQDDTSPFTEGTPDGLKLWRIAVRFREMGEVKRIAKDFPKGSTQYNIKSREYIDKKNEVIKLYNWEIMKDKTFNILSGEKTEQMTGQEVVNKINKIITKWNERMWNLQSGYRDEIGENEFDRVYRPTQERLKRNHTGHYVVVQKFLKKFDESLLSGKRVDLREGIDGLRELSKSQIISFTGKRYDDIKSRINRKLVIEKTGKIDWETYYPHVDGDPKIAAAGLEKAMDALIKDVSMDKTQKGKEITKLAYHYKQVTGDFIPTGQLNDQYNNFRNVLQEMADKKITKEQAVDRMFDNPKVGSQHKRDAHIPGWNVDPEAYPLYIKKIIDNQHSAASQLKIRQEIHDFRNDFWKQTKDNKLTEDWVNYFTMYAQDSLGYPQQIPEHILNDPDMKIKGTPFAWWNDTNVKNRVNQIRTKLGIGEEKDKKLPKELRGIDFGRIARWGNLEAKYQLATLLAHPKSAVANLYGGSVHTLISTGYENFRNARSIKYLGTNVNNKWESMEDVDAWVRSLGVIEDFIINEAGMNPVFKQKRWKDFLTDATGAIKKDPNINDKNLKNIAKKYGIIDSVFNKAAWFMRRPERTLRRDAFMAHYLQAKKLFQGAIKRFDDPILIKMGIEGVKSTQFLYSAPFRPAFARSQLGKVMTRFQLWAWNSVRFRNQILKEAHLRGWKEGTPEFERFKRMATVDMLMFGLANVFMYSLFENALPQPYSWIQDWSDWAFGNEKEKSRAFFGSYPAALGPLQMITPPILRIVPATFKAVIEDDWSRLGGYYAWSMFPFGRMGYDIFGNVFEGGKGGLLENPHRFVEKVSGIPYQQIPRQFKKYQDEKGTPYPRIM